MQWQPGELSNQIPPRLQISKNMDHPMGQQQDQPASMINHIQHSQTDTQLAPAETEHLQTQPIVQPLIVNAQGTATRAQQALTTTAHGRSSNVFQPQIIHQ